MTTKRRLRVAVAGLGYWASNIARNLAALEDVELAWCCDPDESSRARHALAFLGARFTGALGEVLADESVDRSPTPVPLHARIAIDVLQAGKHCFVEKPLAQSVADPEAAVEAARAPDRVEPLQTEVEHFVSCARRDDTAIGRRVRAARRAGAGGVAELARRHAPRRARAQRRALMPRLSVVVTHKSRAEVAAAPPELRLDNGDELDVVDNASADGTVGLVREVALHARIVETGHNAGFARRRERGSTGGDRRPCSVPEPRRDPRARVRGRDPGPATTRPGWGS
jgi:hypothetical protein